MNSWKWNVSFSFETSHQYGLLLVYLFLLPVRIYLSFPIRAATLTSEPVFIRVFDVYLFSLSQSHPSWSNEWSSTGRSVDDLQDVSDLVERVKDEELNHRHRSQANAKFKRASTPAPRVWVFSSSGLSLLRQIVDCRFYSIAGCVMIDDQSNVHVISRDLKSQWEEVQL